MLCEETHCINPKHMIFGRRDLNGVPNDTLSSTSFHKTQLNKGYVMDQKSLKDSISDMTVPELHALITETRTSRRAGASKKRDVAQRRKSKKNTRDVTEEIASLFAGMSPEEQKGFLTRLESNE